MLVTDTDPIWHGWADPRFIDTIEAASRRYQVDSKLVAAVIKVESDFRPHAISPKGAQGLMQLMPATAKQYKLKDAFDPESNIDAGVRHLSGLLNRYAGEPAMALAAYNAGAGTVKRYGGIPPYPETQEYIGKVIGLYQAD